MYNNIEIENLEANNVSCLGEGDDTSFILFDSGENENILSLRNMKINNCMSNGSFIKILGINNNILIENSNFINNYSYGPIIDNNSNKV